MAIKKRPFIVSFYSYKGGTGRTTAAANVAAILAQKGKRVVCIDMDMEGPGLAVVFNVPEDLTAKGLQSYFAEDSPFPERLLLSLNDVLKVPKEWSNLYLIPGSSSFSGITDYSDGNRMINRMKELKESINTHCSTDFLILDSPNGYGDLAALSMYTSDYLIVLFRWSRQHLLGTVRVSEFTKRYSIPFLPVASCVPSEKGHDEQKKAYLSLLKSTISDSDPVKIADDDCLKWVEKVVLFDKNPEKFVSLSGYNEIADVLLSKVESSPVSK